VTATNSHKAALLLAGLEPGAAAELLKGVRPELLTEIASEMVRMEEAAPVGTNEHVREFYLALCKPRPAAAGPQTFVKRVLETAVGKQRGEEVFDQARRMLDQRDPFLSIRDTPLEELAQALAGEHPQVAALVLLELTPEKSATLLLLLEEAVRQEAVYRMTCGENVSPEARARIAAVIRNRLAALRKAAAAPGAVVVNNSPAATARLNAQRRKVALLLRGLSTEVRDNLVKSLAQQDAEVTSSLQNLMVLWEDIPLVSERNLQTVLRNIDARKLALALTGSNASTADKIRANISERARSMIDEETTLMKKPKADEIETARETVLGYLRQLNASGELQFEEH
jgi:flagellar motor switch protein FliG